MRRTWPYIVLLLVSLSCARTPLPEAREYEGVAFRPMPYETLPPLNLPRQAHALYYVNGELVVIGGHINGFLPTATAEYFSGGKWHLVETLYLQDDPATAAFRSNGHIVTAGGYAEAFGIGQTWGAEQYNPSTHRFSHLPILDTKRTHASMLELSGGRLLVAGNWYRDDALEVFTPGEGFHIVKEVAQHRSKPEVLRSAPDNALIFGPIDNYGNEMDTIVVDRLVGEPFVPDVLQEWRPPRADNSQHVSESSRCGEYDYLLLVTKDHLEYRIMRVTGESFSLLPLEHDIPTIGPWGRIWYNDHPQVDRSRQTAWLQGIDWERRLYLIAIHYGEALEGKPAPLEVYYSLPLAGTEGVKPDDSPEARPYISPDGILLPDGRFVTVGGGFTDYYTPVPYNYVFYPGRAKGASMPFWGLGGAALLLVIGLAVWLVRYRRKTPDATQPEEAAGAPSADLMTRITALMEEKEFFRRKDLRLADVAAELGTNTTYISACINGLTGQNFPAFLNGYRVRYAQQLMREHPEMRLAQVSEDSGFVNETTFLRSFKKFTGLTPSGWKAQ